MKPSHPDRFSPDDTSIWLFLGIGWSMDTPWNEYVTSKVRSSSAGRITLYSTFRFRVHNVVGFGEISYVELQDGFILLYISFHPWFHLGATQKWCREIVGFLNWWQPLTREWGRTKLPNLAVTSFFNGPYRYFLSSPITLPLQIRSSILWIASYYSILYYSHYLDYFSLQSSKQLNSKYLKHELCISTYVAPT
jgi:hypothetical protein